MKKNFVLRNMCMVAFTMLLMLFALPQHAQAVDYDLWIAKVRVTSSNCGDLSEIRGVYGTVKYDPVQKVLYLNNATITGTNMYDKAIESQITDLVINVEGTNKLTSGSNTSGVYVSSSAIIRGSGTLNVFGGSSAIYVGKDASLTIKDCRVNAKGSDGIQGYNGGYVSSLSSTLIINNAAVTAMGNGDNPSISNFKDFSTIDCKIDEPVGAVWNPSKYAVCDENGVMITDKVVINKRYAIWIAGEEVTSSNYGNLSVIDGVEGTASYNPSNKTLSLTNASITTSYTVIESNLSGLIISVAGTNTLESTEGSGIYLSSSATISGDGSLSVLADNIAIYVRQNVTLTIKDCAVNAKGHWGITGDSGELSEKLIINNAGVTAQSSGSIGSICDLQSLLVINGNIIGPAGAVWNSSKHAVCDGNGNKITGKVEIGKTYDLWIADKRVTSANCRDLAVIDGVDGTVNYDPNDNKLYLNNSEIITSSTAIMSNIPGLIISVGGTNTLISTEGSGISLSSSGTISGTGSMNVLSANVAIYVKENVTLTIKDCSVDAKGRFGISGLSGYDSETVIVNNADVTAVGDGNNGSICDLQSFSIRDCRFITPAGAVWNSSNHAVCDANGMVKQKVVIERIVKYDLRIGGEYVTSVNCSDLSVVRGVEGTVSYDPSNKTLYLKNATITSTFDAINSNISGLIINVEGTNMATSRYNEGIFLYSSAMISGTGSLNVFAFRAAVYVTENVTLTIKDCSVSANGQSGFLGNGGSSVTVTINNATVTAKGDGSSPSICGLQNFSTIGGSQIIEPAGAVWSDVQHAVCDGDGNKVKGTVVIMGGATGVTNAKIGYEAKTPYIYSVDGKKVSKPIDSLGKGIYIIDGKKVIKR